MPVCGGIFATRERAFLALESSPEDYVNNFQSALDHLMPPKLVSSAPCKEVIYTGSKVDLTQLPDTDIFRQGPRTIYYFRVVHQP